MNNQSFDKMICLPFCIVIISLFCCFIALLNLVVKLINPMNIVMSICYTLVFLLVDWTHDM